MARTRPAPARHSDLEIEIGQGIRGLYIRAYRALKEELTGVASRYGSGPLPWDGDDRVGRSSLWPQLARACIAEGIAPAALVRAAFELARMSSRPLEPPWPNWMLSETCRRRASCGLTREEARLRLDRELRRFEVESGVLRRRGMSAERAGSRVLNDPTIELSPLFRYAVARRCGDLATAGRHRDRALVQYRFGAAGYDGAWADLIDDEIRAAAGQLARAVVATTGPSEESAYA